MYKKIFGLLILCFLMTGCSIQQSIETSKISLNNELCIIENTKVRDGFLNTFTSVLSEKHIKYRLVNERTVPTECIWTATYTANWRWDMAIYMSYANIKIFVGGRLDGEAVYDATRGGANMGKFIDAEVKIRELVNQLILLQTASLSSSDIWIAPNSSTFNELLTKYKDM